MGAPIYVVNHTKKECIGFSGESVNVDELQILLPYYHILFLCSRWDIRDDIKCEQISCGIEDNDNYVGYKCIKMIY